MHRKAMSFQTQLFLSDSAINPVFIHITIGGVIVAIIWIYWFATMPLIPKHMDREHSLIAYPDSIQEEMRETPVAGEETSDRTKTPDEKSVDKPKEPTNIEEVKKKIEVEWDQLLKVFEAEGISVNKEKKTVEVKGTIIRDPNSPRKYPIEYVIISEGGSAHEALIMVKATPSNLNAALLSLGLNPGKTITSRKKDPPPPQDEIDSGNANEYELIPPTGQVVYIYVRYKGWNTRPIRFLEDLILDFRTGRSMKRVGWVYIGSRFAEVLDGRKRVRKYMADMERNIVACYLTGFGNAIFDINTIDGIYDTLFDVHPEDAPPMGAKVDIIFALNPL